jgi:DUF4097 and DUF4098 domain-containing protein YvlB
MIWIARPADGPAGGRRDHQVMDTESPKNRAFWRFPGLVVLAAVAVGGFAVAASARHVEESEKNATFPAAKRLNVESGGSIGFDGGSIDFDRGAGSVVIHGQDRADVKVSSRIRSTGTAPQLESRVDGDQLRLRASCQHSFFNWGAGSDTFGIGPVCAVSYTIAVPKATALSVDSHLGDVRADGIASPSVVVNSGTGDVELDFVSVPRDVQVDSGTGDVTVRLPEGSYSILTDTGIGDVRLGFGIADEPNSTNRIRVDSGTGDVTIERSDV